MSAELKTFVVAQSEYMGDPPDMYGVKTESLSNVIRHMICDGDSCEECEDADECVTGPKLSEEQVIAAFKEMNGDGQPYYMIGVVNDDGTVTLLVG